MALNPPTNSSWSFYHQKNTAVSMNVNEAWKAGYTGKGILVAVVDDGVRIDHPDLKSKIVSHSSRSDILPLFLALLDK